MHLFDHRREDARTDWEPGGLTKRDREALPHQSKALAIEAGISSYPFPMEPIANNFIQPCSNTNTQRPLESSLCD